MLYEDVGIVKDSKMLIAHQPVLYWLDLFYLCHEFNGTAFIRLCWPEDKPVMQQNNLVIVIFDVIKSQLIKLYQRKYGRKT